MKQNMQFSKYLVTCAALTLATLATCVVSTAEYQSHSLTNVICEQIKVANSSFEGDREKLRSAYPEGCRLFNIGNSKLFKNKCLFGINLSEEMKYQKLNRSLHSFKSTFTTLRRNLNIPNMRQEDTGPRNHILDTVIKNLLILQTEVKESSDILGKPISKDPSCYEIIDPSILDIQNRGQMCTTELLLFDEYKLFLRNARKGFCRGMRKRKGGRKQGNFNNKKNGKRIGKKNRVNIDRKSKNINKIMDTQGSKRPNRKQVDKMKHNKGSIASKRNERKQLKKHRRKNQKQNKNQLKSP